MELPPMRQWTVPGAAAPIASSEVVSSPRRNAAKRLSASGASVNNRVPGRPGSGKRRVAPMVSGAIIAGKIRPGVSTGISVVQCAVF